MEPSYIFSIAALGLSTGVFVYNWRRNSGTDTKKMWEAIASNTSDIAVLKKQGDLIWGLVEQQLAKAMIRPTHIELDGLLEKVVRGWPLTDEQERRLIEMLTETVNDKNEVPGVRAMGATILAIRLAKLETSRELNQCA